MTLRHLQSRLLGATFLALAVPVVGQRQSFLDRTQQADGSWLVEQYGGEPDAVLRTNALLLLAHLGDGSTSRSGPRRELVRNSVRWLRRQQDESGRLLLRADPDWPLDHAIGTFALCEELRLSRFLRGGGRDQVFAAVDALGASLVAARPAPSVEFVLWAELCAHSLRRAAREFPGDGDVIRVVPGLHEAAERLAVALAKVVPAAASTPREQAAALLREAHAGRFPAADDALPPAWPTDLLVDPLASFYAAAALFCRGGPTWKLATEELKRQVVKAQRQERTAGPDGEVLYGTWDPKGPFGAQNGRLGSTAVGILLLEVYYRYVRIAVLGV